MHMMMIRPIGLGLRATLLDGRRDSRVYMYTTLRRTNMRRALQRRKGREGRE